jgi:hypothetical protein
MNARLPKTFVFFDFWIQTSPKSHCFFGQTAGWVLVQNSKHPHMYKKTRKNIGGGLFLADQPSPTIGFGSF